MGVYPPAGFGCWLAIQGGSHGIAGPVLAKVPPWVVGQPSAGWIGPQCCCSGCCWYDVVGVCTCPPLGVCWLAPGCGPAPIDEGSCCAAGVCEAGVCGWPPGMGGWWFIPTVCVRTVKVHKAAAAGWYMFACSAAAAVPCFSCVLMLSFSTTERMRFQRTDR